MISVMLWMSNMEIKKLLKSKFNKIPKTNGKGNVRSN